MKPDAEGEASSAVETHDIVGLAHCSHPNCHCLALGLMLTKAAKNVKGGVSSQRHWDRLLQRSLTVLRTFCSGAV